MSIRRWINATLLALLAPCGAWAQTYTLTESPPAGTCTRVQLAMNLTGELKVPGGAKPLPLKANAEHDYVEKILVADGAGPRKAARLYRVAKSHVGVGDTRTERTLDAEHQLIISQVAAERALCYCPSGPLTRSELELVSEHLDTVALLGVLPTEPVEFVPANGDQPMKQGSWKVSKAAAQALGQFEGLIEHDLTGKIVAVSEGQVRFALSGSATGIELGAQVKLTIAAEGKYDLVAKRLVEVTWTQKDARDLGPVNPATNVETTVQVRRTPTEEPKELIPTALTSVPAGLDAPPAGMQYLLYTEAKKRFALMHERGWHLVGQPGEQSVFRLLERGDLLAQATITPWEKADAGKHLSVDEFKQAVNAAPGWELEAGVEEGEIPTDAGKYVYRVVTKGALDGVKVVQIAYLVANSEGDQAVIVFTTKPVSLPTLGTRDVAFVNALEWLKK
jgi:hypothetical protein